MDSDGGGPGSGTHQGACGQRSTLASTNTTPPPAGAVASSQAHAPATSSSSHTSVSCRIRRASSAAAGWLSRGSPVRLERVAEAAVRIAVRGDGVAHGLRRTAFEKPLVAAAIDHAGVRGQELDGLADVW